MSKKPCPICQDPIDKTARTVTVGGVAYDVCCEECAQQAQANQAAAAAGPHEQYKKAFATCLQGKGYTVN